MGGEDELITHGGDGYNRTARHGTSLLDHIYRRDILDIVSTLMLIHCNFARNQSTGERELFTNHYV